MQYNKIKQEKIYSITHWFLKTLSACNMYLLNTVKQMHKKYH